MSDSMCTWKALNQLASQEEVNDAAGISENNQIYCLIMSHDSL